MRSLDHLWIPEPNSGCWIWLGRVEIRRGQYRYGRVKINRKHYMAHRVFWEQKNGQIPDGMFVLHRCDNMPCVNPDHLFLGTQADNQADMVSKGRSHKRPGEKHPGAILTAKKVLAIRADSRTNKEIAKKYGVSKSAITLIKKRKRWSHI